MMINVLPKEQIKAVHYLSNPWFYPGQGLAGRKTSNMSSHGGPWSE